MWRIKRNWPGMLTVLSALAFTLGTGAMARGQQTEVPADALISLQMKPGFGIAPPGYSVTINADGIVTYEGEGSVRVTGRRTRRIAQSAVAALLAQAESIGFFALRDGYWSFDNGDGTSTGASHQITRIVTITVHGRTKRVETYLGAPESLDNFETAIYKTSGIERWVFLDEVSLDELVQSGWSAPTDQGAIFLHEAVERDAVAVARRLIELGADIRGWSRQRIPPLLVARSAAMVDLLVAAGADPHERRDQIGPAGTPLMAAATKTAPVAEALLKAGARLEEPDENGHTAVWFAACAANASVVRVLLAAGANPRGSWAAPTAVDCVREKRQNPSSTHWDRVFNHGHPTDQELDEVATLLTTAEQQRRR